MHVTNHVHPLARRAAALLAAVVVLVVWPGHAAHATPAAQADAPTRTVSGSVTIDGLPAPRGAVIIGETVTEQSTAAIPCGEAAVVDDGTFRMALADDCRPGMALRLRLAEPALEARDQIPLAPDDATNVLVRFEQAVATTGAEIGATLADAEVAQTKPLIQDREMLILLILIAGAAVVLLGYIAHVSAKDTTALARVLVEGMILSLAIIAIIVLGASAKLTSEGLVSVLAAIVGYSVGRSKAPSET